MMIITIITAIRLLYILPDIQLAVNQRGLLLFLNFFSTIHFNIVVCDFFISFILVESLREGTETIWCHKLRAQQYNLPQQIKIY